MKIIFRKIFLLFVFSYSINSFAQQLTGMWQGVMPGSGGTFLQMNLTQKGYELCGFTYDYVISDKSSFCKAKLEGRFDPEKNLGITVGTGFIANSGTHVLMRIRIWREKGDSKNVLHAVWMQDNIITSIFGGGDGDPFILKRVSSNPTKLPDGVPPCFPKVPSAPVSRAPVVKTPSPKAVEKPVTKPPVKKPVAAISPSKPIVVKPPAQVNPVTADPVTVPKVAPIIVKPQEPVALIVKQMNARKKSEQSRTIINTSHINLKVYDNGTVDNDSVSIFYNGRLLLCHQRLSEKAIELNIDLDENRTIHEITMYAENLGSIPPNTALIVVTAGRQRFELRSKASLEENAVLVFEYKKDE